jgi:hypothetical protein
MANLAIKGHSTRGSEVIGILKMLGGNNVYKLTGNTSGAYYIIEGFEREIRIGEYIFGNEDICFFTLDEFEEKFPYKVGDKVMTDDGDKANIVGMVWDNDIDDVFYEIQIGIEDVKYPKELLQPYKEETITIGDFKANTKEWLIDKLHGMIISDAIKTIGNIHDELHKPKYPKTFIEVLNFWHPDRQLEDDYQRCYKKDLVEKLQDLLYARDAYWKIAGEQMGLGKPWKPDWLNVEQDKYVLFTHNNAICSNSYVLGHNILAFPTEEMRDAFYENFKDWIEQCKELL